MICDVASVVSEWLGRNGVELLVFGAELLVAYVIFLEVEHSRDSSFLEKATSKKADEGRRKIYAAFFEGDGTREERVERFGELLWEKDDTKKIRKHCHNQLAMFHEMGFQTTRKFLGIPLVQKRERYLSVFPHAPVFFWFIAADYVRKRRAMTGPWFGTHALVFIRESIEYVLKNAPGGKIVMGLPGDEKSFDITRDDMEKMMAELHVMINAVPKKK